MQFQFLFKNRKVKAKEGVSVLEIFGHVMDSPRFNILMTDRTPSVNYIFYDCKLLCIIPIFMDNV